MEGMATIRGNEGEKEGLSIKELVAGEEGRERSGAKRGFGATKSRRGV